MTELHEIEVDHLSDLLLPTRNNNNNNTGVEVMIDEPRSTSMTRVEDIPPSAKMLTVNVNGSKFDKPHQKN